MQETKNIKLVAYLRYLGIHPDKVDIISRGRAKYYFQMDPEAWVKHKKEFDRSELIKYAACIDAIVDLAY